MNVLRPASLLAALAVVVASCSSHTDGSSTARNGTPAEARHDETLRGPRSPHAAAPSVAAEIAIDSPPAYVPANGSQTRPAAAWNGANHLAVWSDPRNALGGGTVIYGARVNSGGGVLDPAGIVLSSVAVGGSQHEVRPAVATEGGGGSFLVAWLDSGSVMSNAVAGAGDASASPGATVLGSGASGPPVVAYTAPGYLVVWQTGSGVVGVRVSTANVPLDVTPFSIAPACTGDPAITTNGTSYLVVCASASNVTLTLVSPLGTVGTQQNIALTQPIGPIALASDGNNFLACAALPPSTRVGCTLLNGTLSSVVVQNVNAGDGFDATHPALSIAYGGGQYLIAFTTPGAATGTFALRAVHVNQDGSTPDAGDAGTGGVTFLDRGTVSAFPSIDYDGSRFGIAWQDDRNGADASDIYGGAFSSALVQSGNDVLVSLDPTTETSPSLVADGAEELVAYQHNEDGFDAQIYAVRLTPAGAPIDSNPLVPSSATGARGPSVFKVGLSVISSAWGVLWTISGQVQGVAIPATGAPGTSGTVASTTAATVPVGACDSGACVIVWQDGRNAGTTGQDLYATTIGPAGPGGVTVAIVTDAGDQTSPVIASTGTGFLVAYVDGGNVVKGIPVTRTSTTLTPGASFPISGSGAVNHPSVATDGSIYFVVWDDGASIDGRPVKAGAAGAQVTLASSALAGGRRNASVAWDGYQFVSAWEDRRAGNADIYAARVSSGTVLDPDGFAVSTALEDELHPSIAGEGGRVSVVAYQSQHVSSSGPRIYVRVLSDKLTTGTGCVAGDECALGFCVDGVCCESACSGTCQACAGALTGQSDGLCRTVFNGTDPHASCTAKPPLSCEIETCESGACAAVLLPNACDIGGACYAQGQTDPSGACQACEPGVSQSAWTPVPCPDAGSTGDAGVEDSGTDAGGTPVDAGDAGQGASDAGVDGSDAAQGVPDGSVDAASEDASDANADTSTNTPDTGSANPEGGGVSGDAGVSPEGGSVSGDAGGASPEGGGVSGDAGATSSDGGETVTDASAALSDAEADASTLQVPGSSGGCGCRTAPVRSNAPFAPLVACAVVIGLRRRRRRAP